jgi:predicted nuclease with TOPRIM domain
LRCRAIREHLEAVPTVSDLQEEIRRLREGLVVAHKENRALRKQLDKAARLAEIERLKAENETLRLTRKR